VTSTPTLRNVLSNNALRHGTLLAITPMNSSRDLYQSAHQHTLHESNLHPDAEVGGIIDDVRVECILSVEYCLGYARSTREKSACHEN
jgi:hypothetical protein